MPLQPEVSIRGVDSPSLATPRQCSPEILLIGSLIASDYGVGVLPTAKVAQLSERNIFEVGREPSAERVPSEPRYWMKARGLFCPLPPSSHQIPRNRA